MYQLPLSALLLATLVPLGQSIFTDGLRPCSVAPPIAPREQVSEGRTHFGSTHDQVPILQAPRYDNTTSLYIHRSFCGSLFFRLYRCPIVGPREIHERFVPMYRMGELTRRAHAGRHKRRSTCSTMYGCQSALGRTIEDLQQFIAFHHIQFHLLDLKYGHNDSFVAEKPRRLPCFVHC